MIKLENEELREYLHLWREHSITLNSLAWKAADKLGLVGEECQRVYANPEKLILEAMGLPSEEGIINDKRRN